MLFVLTHGPLIKGYQAFHLRLLPEPLSWTSAFINKHACVANKIVSFLIVCKYIMVMLIHHDHRTLRIAIRTHVTYAKEACHCSLSKEETEGKSELLGSGIAEVQLQLHKGKPDQHLSLHCMNDIPKVFNGSVEKRNSNECEVRYLQCKAIFVERYSTVHFCMNLLRASKPRLKELRQGLRV